MEKSIQVVINQNWIREKCYRVYEKSVRWADITDEEREVMKKRREEEPDLPEDELNVPERFMFDLDETFV